MKYPIVIPYISKGAGKELRHSLRSLKNMTNFNGEVYVVGDGEIWFKNIERLPIKRVIGKPYYDQVVKMRLACDYMPEKFIASMDDIYITKPTNAKVYQKGDIKPTHANFYQRTLQYTKVYLNKKGVANPINYECHAPMLVERDKLIQTLDLILKFKYPDRLQWRSIYGNLNSINAVFFEDKKTRTSRLKEGDIISTHFYTQELEQLFPEPSEYEGDV